MMSDTLERRHTFTIVPDRLIEDTSLSKYAKLAYLCIARHADKNRVAFPSTRKLAELSQCGRRQICQGIEELLHAGYLKKENRSVKDTKAKSSNLYTLIDEGGSYTNPRGSYEEQGVGPMRNKGGSYEEQEVESIKKNQEKKNPDYVGLVSLLIDRIEQNDSKAFKNKDKSTVCERWYDSIRLLIDRDGRSIDEVRNVIDWCQDDGFWKTNILSADKLRKQFHTLSLQMKSKKNNPRDEREALYREALL